MIVVKLTKEQAESIKGKEYTKYNLFNPIQDANDDWIISLEEIEQCDIDWLKELPLIDYLPKEHEEL